MPLFNKTLFIAGFAMFSMFFGSGNLVFPLMIGSQMPQHIGPAFLGLFLTAVIVPFLGLLGIVLYDGNRQLYFSRLGKITGFILTFLMLALIGPLGVVPRCITVAYGGLAVLYPQFPFALFSAIFCAFVTYLVWKPGKVVDIIGKFLTPLKLGSIIILIVCGLFLSEGGNNGGDLKFSSSEAFSYGFFQGYQMLDLIAAFFFSATITQYLIDHLHMKDPKAIFKMGTMASIIGASLLCIIYAGFVILGAKYADSLSSVSGEKLLATLSLLTMGKLATPFFSFTIIVACLATAVILVSLFIDFIRNDIVSLLEESFQKRIEVIKVPTVPTLITVGLSYIISLLGFSQICSLLGEILMHAYPALIAYSVAIIIERFSSLKIAPVAFWGGLAVTIFTKMWL